MGRRDGEAAHRQNVFARCKRRAPREEGGSWAEARPVGTWQKKSARNLRFGGSDQCGRLGHQCNPPGQLMLAAIQWVCKHTSLQEGSQPFLEKQRCGCSGTLFLFLDLSRLPLLS